MFCHYALLISGFPGCRNYGTLCLSFDVFFTLFLSFAVHHLSMFTLLPVYIPDSLLKPLWPDVLVQASVLEF